MRLHLLRADNPQDPIQRLGAVELGGRSAYGHDAFVDAPVLPAVAVQSLAKLVHSCANVPVIAPWRLRGLLCRRNRRGPIGLE